jgi:hypothetical protein
MLSFYQFSGWFKSWLNEVKPPADATDFKGGLSSELRYYLGANTPRRI